MGPPLGPRGGRARARVMGADEGVQADVRQGHPETGRVATCRAEGT